MYVSLVAPRPRRGMRGLREYAAGSYPVPGWSYAGAPDPSKCCGSGRPRRGMRGLGDDVLMPGPGDSSLAPFNPVTGLPTDPNAVQVSIYPTAPGGGSLTSAQLATIAANPSANIVPAVNASTLLAAAAMPGAPAVVKQAASAFSSANPVASLLSGSVAGIPTYLLLGGGLLLVLLASSKRR